MIKKTNKSSIVIATGILTLGIIVGRMSAPTVGDEESQKGVISVSRLQSSVTPKDVNRILPAQSARVVAVAPGESLFDAISVQDFDQRARAAFALSDEEENDALLRVLISEWAKKDPLGAVEYAQSLENRGDLVYQGLKQMAQQSPDKALSWIEQNINSAGEQRYLSMGVYTGMSKVDPVGAVARVEQMAAGSQRDQLLSITVNEWAKQDIHAAFDWIETAELNPQFSHIYSQVMGRYIQQDPLDAAALVSEMESGDNKVSFASQVAVIIAEQDIDYALDWVDTLDGNAKKYAVQGIVDRWAKGAHGKDAMQYVLDNRDDPDYKNLLSTVAVQLAHHNPEVLESSFETLDEAGQLVAAQHLASVYSINDPIKSDEWIESLSLGPVRDVAVTSALKQYKYSNVSHAFDLSETLSNTSKRAEQIGEVMSVWVAVDSPAAEEALNASLALSSSQKKDVLDRVYRNLKVDDYLLPAKPVL